jgi:plastocyanin
MSALLLPMSLLVIAAVGCTGGDRSVEGTPGQTASAVSSKSGEQRHGTAEIHEKTAGAVSSKPGDPRPAEVTNQIVIDNFTFDPPTLTIPVGTKVTWVNHDDVPHTATSTAKPKVFDSKTLDTNDRYSHVFAAPGIYEYFCAVHPKMTGKIVVK